MGYDDRGAAKAEATKAATAAFRSGHEAAGAFRVLRGLVNNWLVDATGVGTRTRTRCSGSSGGGF